MNFPTKVLIVDDEAHVRAFLGRLAQADLGGPALFEAPDAATALELFQRERPDLVLLDTNLIGTSGLDVLEQIRALDEDVVIIMLSTTSVMSAIQEAIDRGANGFVLKNVGSEKVASSLLEAVTESFGTDSDDAA
ncbi:MAG: response regulator transcription factor [Opitutus sp.]